MRAIALVLTFAGCIGTKPEVHDSFDGVDEKSDSFSTRMKLLGTIDYGQTLTAPYHNPPRYLAYKVNGRKGDPITIDVHSDSGDAVTWLCDSAFNVVASNDDASPSTLDSHIATTLPGNSYIIVRDYNLSDGAFSVSLQAPPHNLDAWLGRSIYFVVTDRFANGDSSNDNADGFASDRSNPNQWHGGDLQGLIDHLDYIAGMGFTGIWITPVVKQHDKNAYHGYWGWDFSQIDGHLGSLAKLQELVQAAHTRGIAVMIDTVANHTGRYNDQAVSFPDASLYHHNGNITDWNNANQLENFDVNGLNDLAQENPIVRQTLLDHARWLVSATGADGLRIDTVKHVPKTFWSDYSAAAGVFTIGEALDSDPTFVGAYSHALDAALDYPLFFALRSVFADGQSARGLGKLLAQDGAYSQPLANGVFADNHDQPRFLCAANGATDADKLGQLQLALAFTFTARGIPILYYGTEQGLRSCANNREDLFDSFHTTQPLYQFVQKLNSARKASAALRTGAQLERWQDDTAYAFEREAGASAALVTFNLGTSARSLTMHHLHAPAGTVLRDALGGKASATVDGALNLTVQIPARSVLVLTN